MPIRSNKKRGINFWKPIILLYWNKAIVMNPLHFVKARKMSPGNYKAAPHFWFTAVIPLKFLYL